MSDPFDTFEQTPPETSDGPSAAEAEIARLESELAASRKRVDELARAYRALDQDREDFKLRLNRERARERDVEKGDAARLVLETVDELDRCLALSGREPSPVADGVRLIRDGLLSKLQSSGVERLALVGTLFDPNLAEALDLELTGDPEDDQRVVAELRAGYALKDRVIRAARVKVARYVPPASA